MKSEKHVPICTCGLTTVQTRTFKSFAPQQRTRKLTNALDAISYPAFSAAALEASGDIQTWGMHVTVMGTDFTLIHVWETTVNKKKINWKLVIPTSKNLSV